MSIIKKNIAANLAGNLWTGVMSLVFVPFYMHFMGIEAFGLIAIFTTLQAVFGLFETGLANTLNREIARLDVQGNRSDEMRDLIRTLEIPFWGIAILISLTIISLSQFIAYHWVQAQTLSPASIRQAIIIMGLAAGFQWPLSFYSGGMNGLQRQVLLNSINAAMATCRGLGATLVLWLVSPSIDAFFLFQIIISLIHTGLVKYFLWRSLPVPAKKAHFRMDLFKNTWRYAMGVSGITILSTVLAHADKVILSKFLSLKMFGYYSFASLIAMNLNRLVGPVCWAIFPRFVNLLESGAKAELGKIYHKAAQIVSLFTLPVAVITVLFSKEIISLWTQNPVTAENTHLLASLVMIGAAFKSMMDIPYTLQLAAGWTRLSFFFNLASVIIYCPVVIAVVRWKGAVGASSVWPILNLTCLLIYVHLMHKRLLPEEKTTWYLTDIGLPLMASIIIAGIPKILVPISAKPLLGILGLGLVSGLTLAGTGLAMPVTRNWVVGKLSSLKLSLEARA